MRICKKCNAQLEEGARFCYLCGTEVTEDTAQEQASEPLPEQLQQQNPVPPMNNQVPVPQPNNGRLPAAMPNMVPVPMPAQMSAGRLQGKSRKLLPGLLIGAAAVALIIIAALIVPRLLGNGRSINAALYLKDGELNYTSLNVVKQRELTDELDGENTIKAASGEYLGYAVSLSSDGNRVFYPDRLASGDEGVTIYYQDVKSGNKEGEKIDSDISLYKINDAGTKIFYLKGEDNNLYVNFLEDKEKLDTEVSMFYINSDGSKIIYINTDGNIYEKDGKKDKAKIDSNASIVKVSEDLNTMYYLKNNSLYFKRAGKDKVKILSDVSSVIHVYDTGEIYYLKSDDISYKLEDFVNDDMAASDAALVEPTEPVYPTYDNCKPDMAYPTEPDYNSYTDEWGYIDWDLFDSVYNDYNTAISDYNAQWDANFNTAVEEYNTAYNEYLTACEEYSAKQNRDTLRASIEGVTIPVTNYILYYYDMKEAKKVTDTYSDYMDYSSEKPVIIYQNNSRAKITKKNLSKITSYDELYSKASETVSAPSDIYSAKESAASEIIQEGGASYNVKESGDYIYYLNNYEESDNSYDLYEIKISGDQFELPSKIDEDVYSLELSFNNDSMIYYKDVKDNTGDLYIDTEPVDSDVYVYSAYSSESSDAIFYLVDYDTEKALGTLKLYNGKNSIKIGDDIHSYSVLNEKGILYLMDYNLEREEGDLYLYNGSDKRKAIDTDVTALISIYNNGYRGDYSYLWEY